MPDLSINRMYLKSVWQPTMALESSYTQGQTDVPETATWWPFVIYILRITSIVLISKNIERHTHHLAHISLCKFDSTQKSWLRRHQCGKIKVWYSPHYLPPTYQATHHHITGRTSPCSSSSSTHKYSDKDTEQHALWSRQYFWMNNSIAAGSFPLCYRCSSVFHHS